MKLSPVYLPNGCEVDGFSLSSSNMNTE